MRALIVEDDRTMALLLRRLLEELGFTVEQAGTSAAARARALTTAYDAIVLDLQLPDGNGIPLLHALRRRGRDTPVLVVTGARDNDTIVRALDAGADDVIGKPIAFAVFQARVRALVRRGGAKRTEQLAAGNVVLDRITRAVYVGAVEVALSPREYAFLEYFLLHAGDVVPRSALLAHVLELRHDPATNVIDVNVARLRRKLADARATVVITTRRGAGFVLGPRRR